jgi:hypothetical protein
MGTLGIILLIILALFLFYKYIVCVFVNFMNHYLVVPPQVAVNVMLEGLNTPFCKMNKVKIFGSRPFKFIPCPLIPYLDIKCISKPDFYDDLGYKDPKQCQKSKKKKKKKKKGFLDSIGSASTNIFFILVILLFTLMYVGFQHGDQLKLKDTPKPSAPLGATLAPALGAPPLAALGAPLAPALGAPLAPPLGATLAPALAPPLAATI